MEDVPDVPHGGFNRRASVGERQHTHHLGKVGIRGRPDQEAVRQRAVLVGVPAEPRPRAPAGAKRAQLDDRGFVEAARFTALAAHDEVGEVAARAPLVEPELPSARLFGLVRKTMPVDVVDMALRARPHETGGYSLTAVEAAPVVERLAMDEPP